MSYWATSRELDLVDLARMDDDGALLHYVQRAEMSRRRAGFALARYQDATIAYYIAHNRWAEFGPYPLKRLGS